MLCRWRGSHSSENVPSIASGDPVDPYSNNLASEVRAKLMKNQYSFDRAEAIVKFLGKFRDPPNTEHDKPQLEMPNAVPTRPLGHVTDEDQIRTRSCEKRKVCRIQPFVLRRQLKTTLSKFSVRFRSCFIFHNYLVLREKLALLLADYHRLSSAVEGQISPDPYPVFRPVTVAVDHS